MALRITRALVCGTLLARATIASAQSVAVEVDQSAGYSTEEVAAVHTKLRAFGEVLPDVRFNATGTWGRQSNESDAFAAAYPYTEHPVVLDAYVERTFRSRRLLGVRVGRYRTPFGISSESDQGYVGFLRNPLIRYDAFFAPSSTFFEHGADVVVGAPRASLEASLGAPGDVGEHTRSRGLDTVLRGQFVAGPLILGASYIETQPHLPRAESESPLRIGDDPNQSDDETVAPRRATFG